jgi:hypothetical protein
MFVKRKLLAAAAALTVVGGVGAAGTLTAGTAFAATPQCGKACIDIFSGQFGNHHHPNYTLDAYKQDRATGTPILLFQTSNDDPGLDFTATDQGKVIDFYQAGLVTSSLALHYGCVAGVDFATCPKNFSTDDPAFEIQYAPFGAATGQCVGLAATATPGEKVSLQPCGESSKTIWVLDTLDGKWADFGTGLFPLINGSDTNFSHPFVLTYPFAANPNDDPRPQLEVTNLTGFQNGIFPELTTIDSNQLWGADFGQL